MYIHCDQQSSLQFQVHLTQSKCSASAATATAEQRVGDAIINLLEKWYSSVHKVYVDTPFMVEKLLKCLVEEIAKTVHRS